MPSTLNVPQFPVDEPLPRFIHIPDPAAGAELNYPIPNTYRMKILGIHALFTPSAAIANRNVDFLISQGAIDLYRFNMDIIQAAGFAFTHHVISGQLMPTFGAALTRWCPAPLPLPFFHGQVLSTLTDNLDVLDQFSNVYLYAQCWPDFVNRAPA